jgi:GT2 family glycosyltransferase
VRSLLAQESPCAEVHVVDNASANGEADRLAALFGDRIRLWRAPQNLGFTGGNNLALRELVGGDARYVALLNNDAIAEPGWLAALCAAADACPEAFALQSRMVFLDAPDRVENTGIELLTSFDVLPRGRGQHASACGEPAWILGACAGAVLYRADVLREVGLLRDDFFANFEDLELSLRALVRGWRCRYVPEATVRHRLNASIAKVRDLEFETRSLRNVAFACLANLPWQVLALNLPWVVLRDLAVLGLAPFTGRRTLLRALCASRRRLWSERLELRRARAALRPFRRTPWWRIWWLQRNPLLCSPRLLWDLLRGRQKPDGSVTSRADASAAGRTTASAPRARGRT